MRRPAGVKVTAPQLAAVILSIALGVLVVATDTGVLTPDTKPEIYLAPGRALYDYFWPWQDYPGMGMASFNVGLAPVCAVIWLVEHLGAAPWLAARTLRLALLLLAGWGAARLGHGIPSVRAWSFGPLALAVAFVANPYVLTAGATLPILLPMATLPWAALFFLLALQHPGEWRWPAAFALAFACGSGMNAGVVPVYQLLALPGLVLLGLTLTRSEIRGLGGTLARCGVGVLLLSTYWMVPTLAARGSGSAVVRTTETLDGIFQASSFAEVLRGLGLWPLYGADANGPWQPGFSTYLTSPLVICASFLLTAAAFALAAWAPARVRLAGTVLVAVAAAVMVAGFPVGQPSPLGVAMRWVFENVPASAAFRTSNKVGGVLILGLALLGVSGLSRLVRLRPGKTSRAVVTGMCLITAIAILPAWSGGLYLGRYDVPAYWQAAADDLRSAPQNQRVWLVPGERLADYRWTYSSPDDLGRALFEPPVVMRTTVPIGSPEAANLMAAADIGLSESALSPQSVSSYAWLMGAGHILQRNDLRWEQSGGPDPLAVTRLLKESRGISLVRTFGAPGENTLPPKNLTPGPEQLAPLALYRVDEPGQVVRTQPLKNRVLVVGDAFAVPALTDAGVLADRPLLSYLGALDPSQLEQALGNDARIVLTDSNRRRQFMSQRLRASLGPLLSSGEQPDSTLALYGKEDQTVLRVLGGSASATQVGSLLGTFAEASPENAFDGDVSTSWQFAGFDADTRQSVTRTFTRPTRLDRVTVVVADLGPRQIQSVRVVAGGLARDANVGPDGRAVADLGGVSSRALTVEVTSTRGAGLNRLGISEVSSPGGHLTRVAVLPKTLQTDLAGSRPDVADKLSRTPIDIVLVRQANATADDASEERSLNRDFTLPQDRGYSVAVMVRPSPATPDEVLDTLFGYDDSVRASASSRAFNLPTLRASHALDGNKDTAWVPASPEAGQTLTIRSLQKRTLDRVSVLQVAPGGKKVDTWADKVDVLVDGKVVGTGPLAPGRSTVTFPETSGTTVQLRIDSITSTGTPGLVHISEVDAGAMRMHAGKAGAGCVDVLSLDGPALSMRPVYPIVDSQPAPWVLCRGQDLDLLAGTHTIRARSGWAVDSLVLRDTLGTSASDPGQAPATTVERHDPTRYTVTTSSASVPFAVLLGQGRAPGWKATIDGKELPAPQVLDGFSMGWIVTDPSRPHQIEITYAPRTAALAALGVSALAAVVALALALGVRWPARLGVRGPASLRVRRPTWPGVRRPPGGWGERGVCAGTVFLLGLLLGGPVGALTGLGLGILLAGRRLSYRQWFFAAAALMGAVPLTWLVGNQSLIGTVTSGLVSGNLVPHFLSLAAVLCLVAGCLEPWLGRIPPAPADEASSG